MGAQHNNEFVNPLVLWAARPSTAAQHAPHLFVSTYFQLTSDLLLITSDLPRPGTGAEARPSARRELDACTSTSWTLSPAPRTSSAAIFVDGQAPSPAWERTLTLEPWRRHRAQQSRHERVLSNNMATRRHRSERSPGGAEHGEEHGAQHGAEPSAPRKQSQGLIFKSNQELLRKSRAMSCFANAEPGAAPQEQSQNLLQHKSRARRPPREDEPSARSFAFAFASAVRKHLLLVLVSTYSYRT
jgi:hypothetical protein